MYSVPRVRNKHIISSSSSIISACSFKGLVIARSREANLCLSLRPYANRSDSRHGRRSKLNNGDGGYIMSVCDNDNEMCMLISDLAI